MWACCLRGKKQQPGRPKRGKHADSLESQQPVSCSLYETLRFLAEFLVSIPSSSLLSYCLQFNGTRSMFTWKNNWSPQVGHFSVLNVSTHSFANRQCELPPPTLCECFKSVIYSTSKQIRNRWPRGLVYVSTGYSTVTSLWLVAVVKELLGAGG